MLHPFTRGSPPASAATYLPACSHTCVRAKHGRSDSSRPARRPRAYPDGSSRLRFCCQHKHMIDRRLPLMPGLTRPTHRRSSEPQVRLPY
jgi:hypothetical protein